MKQDLTIDTQNTIKHPNNGSTKTTIKTKVVSTDRRRQDRFRDTITERFGHKLTLINQN